MIIPRAGQNEVTVLTLNVPDVFLGNSIPESQVTFILTDLEIKD